MRITDVATPVLPLQAPPQVPHEAFKPSLGPTYAPSSNTAVGYKIEFSRHDHHNLELKTGFDLGSEVARGDLTLSLFLPSNVQLKTLSKEQLISDFHSRARLSFPRSAQVDAGRLEVEIDQFRRSLEDLERLAQSTEPTANERLAERMEKVFGEARHLGAVYGEIIRSLGAAQKRKLLLAHSLATAAIEPSEELITLAGLMTDAASVTERLRKTCRLDLSFPLPVLGLLEQYADHLFVAYLAGIRSEFDKLRTSVAEKVDVTKFVEGWAVFNAELDRLQTHEAMRHNIRIDDDIERELHLVRLSHMKKFFQSDMFVDLARRESIKRFSEPLAAGAAGFAALWAVLFQRAANPEMVSVGFRGLFLMCIAIALYVLRDRLKDRGRAFVMQKLSKVLPDSQQDLIAEGKRVGRIAEWFAVKKPSTVCDKTRGLRKAACLSEAEKHLPEDVLQYRRRFQIDGNERGKNGNWGLQEILRINVERYLKHLDDPYKSYQFLDPTGGFSVLRSHRVYHFYAGLSGQVGDQTFEKFYRIVMDKNGIDRVERVT